MAIMFRNIRSGEILNADSEPKIAALWGSSDRGPNSDVQDFGWRLAPEVVVQMRLIKRNPRKLQEIANNYGLGMEDIDEKAILTFISDQTDPQNAPILDEEDFETEYEDEIRRLEESATSTKKKTVN